MEVEAGNKTNCGGWSGAADRFKESLELNPQLTLIACCVICGDEVTVKDNDCGGGGFEQGGDGEETIVKQEVICENDDEQLIRVIIRPGIETNFNERVNCSSGLGGGWTEEEKRIFGWFVKKFELTGDLGWNGDSGNDRFPFCGECRGRLGNLLELDRRVEELQEVIRVGVELLRGRADEREEDAFGKRGVYKKDRRYMALRRQIVGNFDLRSPEESNKSENGCRKASRISTKRVRLISKGPSKKRQVPTSKPLPVALVSSEKFNADHHHLPTDNHKPAISDGDSDGHGPSEDLKNQTDEHPHPDNLQDNHLDNRSRSRNIRRSRRGKRKTVKSPKPNREETNNGDFDFEPPPSPVPPSPPKETKKQKTEDDDQDWRCDEPEGALPSDSEDDNPPVQESDEDDLEFDSKIRRRPKSKRPRIILDPEKRTLSYSNLLFLQVEEDPSTSNKYQCSECNAVIIHRGSNIRSHFRRKHTDAFLCNLCDYRGDSTNALNRHLGKCHQGYPQLPPPNSERYQPCLICGRPTPLHYHKKHMWSHKSNQEKMDAIATNSEDVPSTVKSSQRYQCDQCGNAFGAPAKLRRHKERIHATPEIRQSRLELCSECGGTFLDLPHHRRQAHGVNAKTFTCLESGCGRTFKRLNLLAKHKDMVHRKIRPYQCPQCPRSFSLEVSFKNHVNLHNGVRPWKCDHCPSAFINKGNLTRHVDTYHNPNKAPPKRKPFSRGPTMLGSDTRKRDLISEGKYLPPSALATWAAGREPTSHFVGMAISNNLTFPEDS